MIPGLGRSPGEGKGKTRQKRNSRMSCRVFPRILLDCLCVEEERSLPLSTFMPMHPCLTPLPGCSPLGSSLLETGRAFSSVQHYLHAFVFISSLRSPECVYVCVSALGRLVSSYRLPTATFLGFPGGSDRKESVCNAGDLGLIPGLGRSPGGKHGNPL